MPTPLPVNTHTQSHHAFHMFSLIFSYGSYYLLFCFPNKELGSSFQYSIVNRCNGFLFTVKREVFFSAVYLTT